ncbi:TonB-dependent receptor plug domain-containing protein [Muricoccus pecuniae]|uniref:Iron complex outermembrane receptor protein n=1 Tax=Muricoccus pecuniae TaxID=693023 RepID=A0A840YCB6_9PROT|nr:TonB-dependent receptor [Roseomonas pecuniae]MBB5692182.1 iron complex outermembrane receptor protein [Roseomonas pecuniae]
MSRHAEQPVTSRPVRRAGRIAAVLCLMLPAAAAAQGVDYGALEALFDEPATTSATGKPQRASDVPVDMEIITAEQIRRSGAHDIPAVLARYTSLDVHQYNAHDFSVGVRGFTTPQVPRMLVLVNGRQVYLDHYAYTSWDSVPVQLSEIRQIEVVKGPNSALFGFNAASGVINIITFDAARDRMSTGILRAGTGRYREASGMTSAPIGDGGGIRVSAGLRGEDAWRRGFTDFEVQELDARRGPTRAQAAAEGVFRLAPGLRGSVDASYSRAIGGDMLDYGQFWREDKRIWSLRGRMLADTAFGFVEAQVYHNALKATYAATLHPTDSALTVADLSSTVKLSAAHTVRPLLQLRQASMSVIPGTEIRYRVLGLGGMWDWKLAEPLELTTSLRYDHLWLGAKGYDDPAYPYGDRDYDRSFGEPSWNIGLVWRATPWDTVRLSGGRGISLPSLSDYGWRDSYPAFGYQDTGTPTLAPTVVESAEAGYTRRVDSIDGRLGLSAFAQRYRGFSSGLSTVTFAPPLVPLDTYTPYNLGTAHIVGLEASAEGRTAGGLSLGAKYRLSAVSSELAPSSLDPKRASPRHLVSVRAGWANGPLELDLFGRYSTLVRGYRVNGVDEATLVEVKDYASLAVRAGYRLTETLTVALEGENMLHGRQQQGIGAQAARRIYLSLRADF